MNERFICTKTSINSLLLNDVLVFGSLKIAKLIYEKKSVLTSE
jgi:hypothetical protein